MIKKKKKKSYKRTNEIKGLLDAGHVVVFSDLKKAFITVYHDVSKCKLVPILVFLITPPNGLTVISGEECNVSGSRGEKKFNF